MAQEIPWHKTDNGAETDLVGGLGGVQFNITAGGGFYGLIGLAFWHDWYIDGIQATYAKYAGPIYGGHGLHLTRSYTYFEQDEKIIKIDLRADWYIDSITIHTNKRTLGPYGGLGGKEYTITVPPGYSFGGFKGRAGKYIDSLGFYFNKV